MLVRIYLHTTIKSIRGTEGVALYVLASEIGGKEVTLNGQVIFRDDPKEKWEFKKASANVSHLIATHTAIERLTNRCDALEIYTDSPWICSAWNEGWIDKWRENGWKDVHGNDLSHAECWQMMDSKLSELKVRPVMHLKERHPWTEWFKREAERIRTEIK